MEELNPRPLKGGHQLASAGISGAGTGSQMGWGSDLREADTAWLVPLRE